LAEAVFVQADTEFVAQFAHIRCDFHTHGQHHHVEFFFADSGPAGFCWVMACRQRRALKILDDEVVVQRVFLQRGNSATGILDTLAFPGALVVTLVVFTEGAHIHHEYADIGVLVVFQCHVSLLGRVHAAHG